MDLQPGTLKKNRENKRMKYSCGNYIESNNGNKFFKGDKIRICKEGAWQFYGTITHITSRGIYLDVGNKADKYFRADEIDEISAES